MVTRAEEELEMGVPEVLYTKLVQLINMWSRPDPPVEENVEPPAKRPRRGGKGGPRDGSAGGAGGIAGKAKESGAGVKGKSVVPPSDRQLRPRKGVGSKSADPALCEKVLCWLEQLP